MRSTSQLFTPRILVLLCACTPDSNNIGETLSSGSETGASTGAQTDGVTDTTTDGLTGGLTEATSDAASTTEAESTGSVDTTTDDTANATSTGETTLDETTTDDGTTDTTSSEDTGGDTVGEVFPCGEMTCDAGTQYCSVFVPGVMDAEIVYDCAQIPARCDDAPSCACLPDGEAPPCQCAEDDGFTVTCYGA